jgi:Fur family zinc uptake transcriptional regulator
MSAGVIATFRSREHDHQVCIAEALTAAEDVCRRRGARLTTLRRLILELVWSHHQPVGAYDLLDALRRDRRRAAPPTVYRALEFLIDNGLIHRIESLNAYVGCGGPSMAHSGQFLICRDCQSVAELDDPAIETAIGARATALGFQVLDQTVEVLGLCPECLTEQRVNI